MIHLDWHGKPPHFQLGVGQWLAQVRRGAELVKYCREGVPHKLLYDRQAGLQSCRQGFSTTELAHRTKKKSLQAQEYQEHSSSHSSLPQQQLHVNIHQRGRSYQQTHPPPAQPPPSPHPASPASHTWHSSSPHPKLTSHSAPPVSPSSQTKYDYSPSYS